MPDFPASIQFSFGTFEMLFSLPWCNPPHSTPAVHLYRALSKNGSITKDKMNACAFWLYFITDGDCTKRTSFLVLPLNSYLDTYVFVSTSSLYQLFPRRTVKSVCCWCLCPCFNTASAASQLQVVILLHGDCELVRPSVSVACSQSAVS